MASGAGFHFRIGYVHAEKKSLICDGNLAYRVKIAIVTRAIVSSDSFASLSCSCFSWSSEGCCDSCLCRLGSDKLFRSLSCDVDRFSSVWHPSDSLINVAAGTCFVSTSASCPSLLLCAPPDFFCFHICCTQIVGCSHLRSGLGPYEISRAHDKSVQISVCVLHL